MPNSADVLFLCVGAASKKPEWAVKPIEKDDKAHLVTADGRATDPDFDFSADTAEGTAFRQKFQIAEGVPFPEAGWLPGPRDKPDEESGLYEDKRFDTMHMNAPQRVIDIVVRIFSPYWDNDHTGYCDGGTLVGFVLKPVRPKYLLVMVVEMVKPYQQKNPASGFVLPFGDGVCCSCPVSPGR